jgi:histidine triad (HIT) family protein
MTIFDHLIAGALPASFVYQDARCVAFMDINPITAGHVLVVPRQSVATLDEVDAETRAHLWEVSRKIGIAQRQALGSLAQHLLVNDGKGASQSVPHVHIHVSPRYGDDTLRTVVKLIWHISLLAARRPPRENGRDQLDALAQRIAAAMAP